MDVAPSMTWHEVADQARVLGAPDFADQLDAADEDTLRRAFDRMGHTKAKDVRRFEGIDHECRWRLMKKLLVAWHEGDSDLATTAGLRLLMATAASAQPPEPWQRPPFERGNLAALRHGAASERIVAAELPAVVAEVEGALWSQYEAEAPGGSPPVLDRPLVERLARGLVRLRRLDRYFDEADMLDAAGNPRAGVATYLRVEAHVRAAMGELGIGPAARARLQADRAQGARDAAVAAREAEGALRARYGRPRVIEAAAAELRRPPAG